MSFFISRDLTLRTHLPMLDCIKFEIRGRDFEINSLLLLFQRIGFCLILDS